MPRTESAAEIPELEPVPYNPEDRKSWKKGVGLAQAWRKKYDKIFDDKDLELAQNRIAIHSARYFFEWAAAIELFKKKGVLSLVTAYVHKTQKRKGEILTRLIPDPSKRDFLAGGRVRMLGESFRIKRPDLLVYTRDLRRFCFVEVKGNQDPLKEKQRISFLEIRKRIGVEVYQLRLLPRNEVMRDPAVLSVSRQIPPLDADS